MKVWELKRWLENFPDDALVETEDGDGGTCGWTTENSIVTLSIDLPEGEREEWRNAER